MTRVYTGPIVDVDIHHGWKQPAEIVAYLPRRWREYVSANRTPAGALEGGRRVEKLPIGPRIPQVYVAIPTEKGGSQPGDGFPSGSDYPTLKAQLVDHHNFYRGVLTFNIGTHVNSANRDLNVAIARAVNDWNAETWLTYDERLYGLVCPPISVPDEAAKEVRRVGANPKIVAVLFAGSPWNVPYGDPLFHPVYEAAAELGLQVHVHPGTTPADRPAGGIASYATELATIQSHDAMHHITSLIVNGVFEKYPGVRFVFKEYGVAWLPYLMWRLDRNYELLRLESPWVKQRPSDYIRSHVRLDTQPLDEGRDPDELKRVLGSVDGMEKLLCFATDYPHATSDDPNYVARRLPDGWARDVMCDNACRFYGWELPPADAVFEQPALARAGA